MASELSTTITAGIQRGASVCSATHSGSPLDSIAQHSASTPTSPARARYGRSCTARAAAGGRPLRGSPPRRDRLAAAAATRGTLATSAA